MALSIRCGTAGRPKPGRPAGLELLAQHERGIGNPSPQKEAALSKRGGAQAAATATGNGWLNVEAGGGLITSDSEAAIAPAGTDPYNPKGRYYTGPAEIQIAPDQAFPLCAACRGAGRCAMERPDPRDHWRIWRGCGARLYAQMR